MLYYYSSVLVFIDDKSNIMYKNYNWVKYGVDMFHYYKNKTFNYIYNLKTYPENNWHNSINIYSITDKVEKYYYAESYKNIAEITNEQNFMLDMKNNYDDLFNYKNKNHICLMSKFNDILCVQHTPIYLKNNDTFEKSEMDIISVTYKHPEMENIIELTLPANILYCHNQLFNAAFIYHCLQYQDKPYSFDDKYEIEIIDSNVESKTIKYNEYLHVYKNELIVQSFSEKTLE